MRDLPRRKHLEVLCELVETAGKRALDIGCGDGSLLRALWKRGLAEGVGLEPSPPQLERAHAAGDGPGLRFLAGVGESLNFPDKSFDLVIFFNSLHHLPTAAMAQALREAARVLRPEGLLYVAEPLPEGPHFELAQPVDDETHVRSVAHERLRAAAEGPTLRQLEECFYDAPVSYADFAAFRARMEAVDPARAAAFATWEAELKERFERLGEPSEGNRLFSQPMRVNLLGRRDAGSLSS